MTETLMLEAVTDAIRSASKAARDLPIHPESLLVEDLGLDSLDIVGAVMKLEDRFGVEIDVDDVPTFQSVADLLVYLDRLRVAKAA